MLHYRKAPTWEWWDGMNEQPLGQEQQQAYFEEQQRAYEEKKRHEKKMIIVVICVVVGFYLLAAGFYSVWILHFWSKLMPHIHRGEMNEVVACGDGLEVTVTDLEIVKGPAASSTWDSSPPYLVLYVTYTNNGKESEELHYHDMSVLDYYNHQEDKYYATKRAIKQPSLPEGEIAPGETVSGWVAFEITGYSSFKVNSGGELGKLHFIYELNDDHDHTSIHLQ
jgi:hypothetical protein